MAAVNDELLNERFKAFDLTKHIFKLEKLYDVR